MLAPTSPPDLKVPYSVVMEVSPELAFRWLEGNTHNRPLSQALVDCFARDMKAGRWRLTNQGITFDTAGLLIDGQHRLCAVIEANVTISMRIYFNEPPENRWVFDSGQARSNRDILNLAGEMGEVTSLGMATLRGMLAGVTCRPWRLTASEEADLFSIHREAVEFTVEQLGACPHKGLAMRPTRAVVARAYYAADHGRLAHFCDVLGSGLPADETDVGVLTLRDFLMGLATAGRGLSVQRLRYAKTQWALDAFLDGRIPKRLCGSDAELFLLPEESATDGSRPADEAADKAA